MWATLPQSLPGVQAHPSLLLPSFIEFIFITSIENKLLTTQFSILVPLWNYSYLLFPRLLEEKSKTMFQITVASNEVNAI
ncbi:MAG: hypothetical protein K1X82_01960 [Bacteroidia bacterium]|nr:hypothetical protein [Bacteroidia bacterium]